MAVVSLEEILNKLAKFEPEELSEDYATLLEDISDTVAASESFTEIEDLRSRLMEAERKVADTERKWLERYKNRFYGNGESGDVEDESTVEIFGADEEEEKTLEEVAKEWQ